MLRWEVPLLSIEVRDAPAVSVRNDNFTPYGKETGLVLVSLSGLICELFFFNHSHKGGC